MSVVTDVTSIVSRVRGLGLSGENETARIRDAIAALPGVDSSDPEVLRHRELMIQVGFGGGSPRELEALARVRPLEIAAAPEIATLLPTAEGYVIVRRYWACPDETLVNVEESAVTFSEPARARFRSEIVRLLDHGERHSYARGFRHWWVAQPSGTIVLDSWFALEPCDEHGRGRYLAMIDRMLAERAAP